MTKRLWCRSCWSWSWRQGGGGEERKTKPWAAGVAVEDGEAEADLHGWHQARSLNILIRFDGWHQVKTFGCKNRLTQQCDRDENFKIIYAVPFFCQLALPYVSIAGMQCHHWEAGGGCFEQAIFFKPSEWSITIISIVKSRQSWLFSMEATFNWTETASPTTN